VLVDVAAQRTADSAGDTFPKLLLRNAERFATHPAYRFKDLGIWQTWTWRQVRDQVRDFAVALHALGLRRGDRIAVVGSNRPRLYWTFLAAQSLGATPVPVYADSVADELAYVLDHAEVVMAVAEDQEQVDKLLSIADRVPRMKHLIYDDDRGLVKYDHTHLHALTEMLSFGAKTTTVSDDGVEPPKETWWLAEVAAGRGSDISVMLYTSGTTGRSKGVMLSASRCIAAAADTVAFDKLDENDVVLAYLPLAWVGDHYLNFAQSLVAGFCVACPESPETAPSDLREIGPTFYFAPPRVFEGLLTRVMIRIEDASPLKRRMFHHYVGVAKRWGEKILNGEAVPLSARLSYAIGHMLVYGPLKNVLGFSNIRVAYTAGEAIGPELFSFYRSLGLNLKQLYGQTEAFLYVTAQPDGQIRADTVGPATPNVEIRIAENGEVLYKSPGQFVGYFKEAEKTAETMTPEGFVKTGDAGFFDAQGHLKIIDRANDVGKLANGSLFAPKYIENKLKFFPNIKEAVAFGTGRPYVAAFLNIDLTAVANWAERNDIVYASYQELAAHPQVYEMLQRNVEEVNRMLAAEPAMAGAQIRRFLILHKELDADDGELTRTQKVRRGFIAERYASLVEALYDGSTARRIETQVTFEDGRKGTISGDIRIADAKTFPAAPAAGTPVREAAE
jgi:long-chain acyl-CoA synthetase